MAKVDILNTDKKYDVIYADPPWTYNDNLDGRTEWGAVPYPTMKLEDICNLPIQRLAKKDCLLFMWVTMPMLQEGLEVIKSWGFKYRTCGFCWVKTNPKSGTIYSGLGHWTNGNAELCLLAKKGSPKRVSKSVKQIVLSPRKRHSEKPNEVRNRILELCGGGWTVSNSLQGNRSRTGTVGEMRCSL